MSGEVQHRWEPRTGMTSSGVVAVRAEEVPSEGRSNYVKLIHLFPLSPPPPPLPLLSV